MDGTDGTDGTDGSVDAVGNGESLAQRICRRVLTTARSIDPKASITSVAQLNEDNDATLVRVAAGDGVNPSSLAALLRSAWPLAQVAVVENYAEGTHEAQVLVPSKAEQRKRANLLVSERTWFGSMGTLSSALLLASAATFGGLVVTHMIL